LQRQSAGRRIYCDEVSVESIRDNARLAMALQRTLQKTYFVAALVQRPGFVLMIAPAGEING
jgi:hypothetical protein